MNVRMVCRNGFTLIELLVVLATLALLAAMLLPALAQPRQNSQVIECQANQRQLAVAWMMYARDNNDKLVPNGSLAYQPDSNGGSYSENPLLDPNLRPGGKIAQWCPGNLQYTAMDFSPYYTNWIKAGLLYPYVQNVAVYKCPADLSKCPYGASPTFAVPAERTYSVNCWVGGMQVWAPGYKEYYKLSQMNRPSPARTWVFIEEDPSSIDDAYFVVDPTQPQTWYEIPAALHGNWSVLTYADGHSDAHRWTGTRKNESGGTRPGLPGEPIADLAWLISVSTAPN